MRVSPKINSDRIEYETYYEHGDVWSVHFTYDKFAVTDLFFKKDIPNDDFIINLSIVVDYFPETHQIDDVATISALTYLHGDISYQCVLDTTQKLYFKEELISKGFLD